MGQYSERYTYIRQKSLDFAIWHNIALIEIAEGSG